MTLQPMAHPATEIAHILSITQQHNGFAKLNSSQRRLLLAALLACVIPVDGRIHANEVGHFSDHLKKRYQFSDDMVKHALGLIKNTLSPEQLHQATKQLPEMLSMEDRVNLVGMLWDLALCDFELHSLEEALIYKIADQAGVPRKRVAEEQARAVRLNAIAR